MACFSVLHLFPSRLQPYIVVLAVVFIHLTLGTLYCIGNLTPYVASYLRGVKHEHVSIGAMSWFATLTGTFQGLFTFLGGIIERRLGTRVAIFIGCFMVVLGVSTTYFSIQVGVAGGYVTYGAIFGAGIGIAYAPCIACAMRWVPERKGLVGGITLAGYGLGAFVFNYVATYFVNPDNKSPDAYEDGTLYFDQPDILWRTPYVFLLLAACYGGIELICIIFIENPDHATYKLHVKHGVDFSPKEMLKTQSFYVIWFIYFCNQFGISYISTYYKFFGQGFISDDHFLSLVGSIASIANATGRIFWGFVGDRYSYQPAVVCISALMAILFLTFEACTYGGKAMYLIWVSLVFFAFSGNYALHPMVTAKLFGRDHFATNYGLVFTSGTAAALLVSTLATLFLDKLGFRGFFFLTGGCSLLAFVTACTLHLTDYQRLLHGRLGDFDESTPLLES